MNFSRRRFLDAAAVLAVASPMAGRAAAKSKSDAPVTDAVAIAQAVRAGSTTPLAEVDKAIARLEKANPKINAVHFPNYERARERARAGVTGPLAGVPTLIKDNVPQKGLPNTSGSKLFLKRIPDADGPYVQAIERAGLISIGRAALPEFAETVTTESFFTGITRNPWNLDRSSGGSSGGTGAAVAAGVVPVAHGNDRAGSIRHAAAPCGLVGLKPSRGRMAGDEKSRSVTDLNVQGPLSRTVRDTAAWLAATEYVGEGGALPPVGVVSGGPNRRLVIGVRQEKPYNGELPSAAVQRVFSDAAALLGRLGHDVRHQPAPFDGPKAGQAFLTSWEAGVVSMLATVEKLIGRPLTASDVEPRRFQMAARGRSVSMAQLGEAVRDMQAAAESYVAQFEHIDVYMTPVFSTEPVRIGEFGPAGSWDEQRPHIIDYAGYCWIDNVAGTPAISLPMGFSPGGLPIGIQFTARPGNERVLLELAYQLEGEVRWWRKLPPVWVG